MEMDPEGGRTIELAALGRPFSLGMLYDCRRDSLIPGMTLWDPDTLEKDTRERPHRNSEFEIVASESIHDKSSALNVEASLKASFLGGLVEVDGSAKYLSDYKNSKNQARVTLKYKTTTKFQELSMNHLGRGNVKYPYVFDQGIATHVVTGILYGAQAFFVFDRDGSEREDHQDIEGNLKVMIKKIPCLAIEGQGDLQMSDKDMDYVDKFSCKFHGDFALQGNPVSFQDAVQVYQSLPTLMGTKEENVVPLKVWLMPLNTLDSSAAQLVRQISIRLVSEAQTVLEDFSELEMRCNDALKNPITQQFPQISKKLNIFKEHCAEYKLGFQKTLAEKLPLIRGGGEEESVLAEFLKTRHSSPFKNVNLSEWLDGKEREINIIRSLIDMMKNTKTVTTPSALDREILKVEHAVCFAFTSLESPETLLSALSQYLRENPTRHSSQDFALHTNDVEKDQWYFSNEILESMRKKAKLFLDFAEVNKKNMNICFLTAAITNETQRGAMIQLYKEGNLVNDNFNPPSKPETLAVIDKTHNCVTLKIFPPRIGTETVIHYCVEYCVSGEDAWQQKTASKDEVITVSSLTPNTVYLFRCRAVCSAGLGPAMELCGSIKTLPTNPPGKPQVETCSSELSVSWEKPTELGEGVLIENYILEYAKTSSGVQLEDLPWIEILSRSHHTVISGLQPLTEYVVRVRCECGEDGRSNNSTEIVASTTKREFERLADFIKHTSKPINSASPSVYKLHLKKIDLEIDGCKSYSFGRDSMRRNRTIIVLGATGAGKSTLINGMLNYILGVEWSDGFRFKLIDESQLKSQAHSQTADVSVYKINHQEGFKIDFSVTIVDTPGFGDTRGIERDKVITEQIRKLFTSSNGVKEIDAICFVTQASLARLTPTEKYVFDSVLSIFGKDVAENIRMLVTFADGQQPPVLEAINASGVPCPKTELGYPVHFKFNNSALFADNRSICDRNCSDEDFDEDIDEDNFDRLFWNMGAKSMSNFFKILDKMTTRSLQLTKEVLKERKNLETAVEGLQPQVKAGLAKLEAIRVTKQKIKEHEADICSNENFQIEFKIIKPTQIQITKKGEYITNCQQCSMTCHYPCAIAKDQEKNNCASMRNGSCTVCPGKCVWTVHFNQKYRWEYVMVKEKRTVQELKDKYEKATEAKMSVQELIERQEDEIANLQDVILLLMDQSADCIARLKEIALRPNPLSTPEYIDLLIEGENAEAKEGYLARIQSLEAMKEQAKIISKVAKKEKLTKTEEEVYTERKMRQEKPGF